MDNQNSVIVVAESEKEGLGQGIENAAEKIREATVKTGRWIKNMIWTIVAIFFLPLVLVGMCVFLYILNPKFDTVPYVIFAGAFSFLGLVVLLLTKLFRERESTTKVSKLGKLIIKIVVIAFFVVIAALFWYVYDLPAKAKDGADWVENQAKKVQLPTIPSLKDEDKTSSPKKDAVKGPQYRIENGYQIISETTISFEKGKRKTVPVEITTQDEVDVVYLGKDFEILAADGGFEKILNDRHFPSGGKAGSLDVRGIQSGNAKIIVKRQISQ